MSKKEKNYMDGKELKDIYNHLKTLCKTEYNLSYKTVERANAAYLMDKIDHLLENLKVEVI